MSQSYDTTHYLWSEFVIFTSWYSLAKLCYIHAMNSTAYYWFSLTPKATSLIRFTCILSTTCNFIWKLYVANLYIYLQLILWKYTLWYLYLRFANDEDPLSKTRRYKLLYLFATYNLSLTVLVQLLRADQKCWIMIASYSSRQTKTSMGKRSEKYIKRNRVKD